MKPFDQTLFKCHLFQDNPQYVNAKRQTENPSRKYQQTCAKCWKLENFQSNQIFFFIFLFRTVVRYTSLIIKRLRYITNEVSDVLKRVIKRICNLCYLHKSTENLRKFTVTEEDCESFDNGLDKDVIYISAGSGASGDISNFLLTNT